MPRYFFHLHGSGARDTEGQEFPNDEAAREEASAVARDLGRNRSVAMRNDRLVVTDESGRTVYDEPLGQQKPAALQRLCQVADRQVWCLYPIFLTFLFCWRETQDGVLPPSMAKGAGHAASFPITRTRHWASYLRTLWRSHVAHSHRARGAR